MNNAFEDEEASAIIASIGGDESVRILPYLNRKMITANPKILMGYSDITTLLCYWNQSGLVTFHGPSVMAGFSQVESLPPEFANHMREMLFTQKPTYTYQLYGNILRDTLSGVKEETLARSIRARELPAGTGCRACLWRKVDCSAGTLRC